MSTSEHMTVLLPLFDRTLYIRSIVILVGAMSVLVMMVVEEKSEGGDDLYQSMDPFVGLAFCPQGLR